MDIKTNSASVISVLFLCLFLKTYSSLGADTISVNESVYGYSTIISAGSVFQLGFFKPGEAENYYVGIWYLKDPHKNIVWVAHRENPVTYSSELRISDGNLVLFNDLKIPIWSTNVRTTSSDSVRAVLLDSGNLVLTDGSNLSEPLWQSFDHPTNTWLPGAKLGYNKITKRSQVLTSWKNSEDPAPGLFSFKIDPRDYSYVILWNRSTKNWTSGSWNGETFSLAPEMTSYNINEFFFVSNEEETYSTYVAINSSVTNFSRHVMDVSGQIRQLTWLPAGNRWNLLWSQPRRQCDVYAYCGANGSCDDRRLPFCSCLPGFKPKVQSHWDSNDYSDGCLRRTRLQCGNNTIVNGEREKFLSIFNMSLPDNQQIVHGMSLQDCKASCLNTCSCTAYAYAYERNNCSTWTGDLLNQRQLREDDSRGHTLYLRLAASELLHLKRSSQNKKLYMLSILIVVIPCAACSVHYLRRKKRGTKGNRRSNKAVGLYDSEKHIRDFMHSGQLRVDEKKGIEVPFVVLDSIIAATDNFLEANKLGQGGFGPVYKGKFPGGQEIAIKRLSSGSGQGLQEFKNEVLLIAKLQHRNLVRLLGYCVEGDEKMLLYEYLPNKSLDFFLFDRKMCMLLNWEIRFDIILGIAKGLLYLHHDSRLRIIHRDMKTSNVLLDGEMTPKISDFGLAKIFGGKQTEATTNRVVGTYGYMSPEYALHGLFSIKSDVFSFGVVILEIISGKRNTGFYHSEEALSLLDYAWKLWNENKALDLIDPILRETCSENEFMRCFNIGLLCVQDDPSDRPTMSNVVFMLGSESGSLPSPKQPAFLVKRSLSCRASFDEKPLSRNKLTDTLNEGR